MQCVCSPLDNASIQCSHGKVSASKVTSMKRLSAKAWEKLFSKVTVLSSVIFGLSIVYLCYDAIHCLCGILLFIAIYLCLLVLF